MEEKLYTTKQARDALGATAPEVNYILRLGLVPHIKHTRTGRKLLSESQVAWLQTLITLKRCGASKNELRQYYKLSRKGMGTLAERKAILETKRSQVCQVIAKHQEYLGFLNRQQEYFDQILAGNQEAPEQLI